MRELRRECRWAARWRWSGDGGRPRGGGGAGASRHMMQGGGTGGGVARGQPAPRSSATGSICISAATPALPPCLQRAPSAGRRAGVVGACGGGRQGGAARECRSTSGKDPRNGVRAPLRHASVALPVPRCVQKNAKGVL
jgi:hypothetical protein